MNGDDLRARRLAAGLSQVGLAALASVSPRTVRNAEKGRVSRPRLRAQMADALDGYENRATHIPMPSPSLAYTTTDGATYLIDGDGWDTSTLPPRDRAVCRALLEHSLQRLSEVSE